MMQAKHKATLLLLLLGIAWRVTAKDTAPLLFSPFFAEKNLSNASINCFFQDHLGYMWIGTEDGLNYFNGKTIKIFKHDYQNANSLVDNLVTSIGEDKQGNMWIGTGRGVTKLNPALFTFENYCKDDNGRPLGYKIDIYLDRSDNVWAVSGSELYCFNRARNYFERQVFKANSGLKNNVRPHLFTGIFEDSEKRYWVSSNDRLYRYFPSEKRFEQFTKDSMLFFSVGQDDKGNLFCGTWDNGLYQLNLNKRSLDTIDNFGLKNNYVPQRFNGKTLLWYGNKLSAYDAAEKTVLRYPHNISDLYSARNHDVAALYVDAQNQLWIGYSNGGGIQIMSPSNQIFTWYRIAEKTMDFPATHCFVRTEKYNYVGGWHNYSLAKLDKNNHTLKTWKTLLPGVYNKSNNISQGLCDHKGNIWFAGTPGLICFNEATEKAQLFKMDPALSKGNFFLHMVPEGDSVLWIAGYFCGLSRFSLNTKTFKNWGAGKRVLYWNITKDTNGMLWMANDSGLLTGFDTKTETFTDRYYNQLTESATYRDLLFDSIHHLFWIATDNGLLRVDRNTFAARLFTEKDNLPTNQVNALQFDSRGRLWMATNKGLCFYDPKQTVFKTFFSNNGLPNNVLSQLFSMQSNDELVIGCQDGFSVLKINAIPPESFLPSVRVDKVYEEGKIVPFKTNNGHKTAELAYTQNNIQIEFSCNDLIDSENNQLLFKLEGFDSQWRTAQNGIINYSKLEPGHYQLHVTGVSHTGLKSKQDDFLAIIIHPPFWKTIWFITLAALLLLGLTVLVARYIFTRNLREKILILEKEQAIEKERSRISQDMHDELGSGLTKISIMSEVAMMQLTDPLKAKSQLENISTSSRGLVDNLQDIIWILNSKNDSLENLCAYLQEYALKYFEPFNIRVEIFFPDRISPVRLSEDQRRNILLVFKESFNNISKHSGCTQVTVTMKEAGSRVSFTISDNGKGFDKSGIRNFANGLQNMKRRMENINGTFEISSVRLQGTSSAFAFAV